MEPKGERMPAGKDPDHRVAKEALTIFAQTVVGGILLEVEEQFKRADAWEASPPSASVEYLGNELVELQRLLMDEPLAFQEQVIQIRRIGVGLVTLHWAIERQAVGVEGLIKRKAIEAILKTEDTEGEDGKTGGGKEPTGAEDQAGQSAADAEPAGAAGEGSGGAGEGDPGPGGVDQVSGEPGPPPV
jgi:hypothetical protein